MHEIVRDLIDVQAVTRPDNEAIVFVDGERWTFAEVRHRVRTHAQALQALGVRQGEFVVSWMPNGPVAVLNLLALNYLGAVYVPISVNYRGSVLTHVLRNSGGTLMIAHGALVGRLRDVETGATARIIVIGDERPDLPGIGYLGRDALTGNADELDPPERPIMPWDTQMVIYTSGTTGPSKGVLCSYRHSHRAALEFRNIGPGDRNLTALPMSHVGGVYGVLWALIHGGAVIMAESFRTAEFWLIARRYRVTTTGLLGSMVRFLLDQPPTPTDRDHFLKSVIVAPLDQSGPHFAERFGVDLYTEFNMSELSVPLFAGPNPRETGTCGKPRAGLELRLVDAHDIEVPEGETGELILRTDEPWTISHGYHNDPEATAKAWRNGWFHTGDIFRRDAQQNYFFVDRVKDALRRRGENISSFEVESAILLHPAVREAAVVAAPGEGSEDEVLAVVAPADGATLAPEELIAFLLPRLAHFMVPRYVRIVDDLPRTTTHKIEKHRLRGEGVTSDTWDREAAGVTVRGIRLERRD